MFKILSYQTVYSRKKGSTVKTICMEKDIPTMEDAIAISKTKYGNTKGITEWRFGGLIYPSHYKIKKG